MDAEKQMARLPRFEYTGQTTPEILACKGTHGLSSLLLAFEWGIEAKFRASNGEPLTEAEMTVLAVTALNREVNNGGYHQFFWNSSRQYAPIIVDALRRIGCSETVSITERAIAALNPDASTVEAVSRAILPESKERDAIFSACGHEFYRLPDLSMKLFAFIEAHQDQIQLIRTDDYPRFPARRPQSNAAILRSKLEWHQKGWNPCFEEACSVARELAVQKEIPATEGDIEGAAALFCLGRCVRTEDFEAGEALANRASVLMREDPTYIVTLRDWTQHLITNGLNDSADATSLAYLNYLQLLDSSEVRTVNSIRFWAELLQANREVLPESEKFFMSNFPELDLDTPIEKRVFVKGGRAPGTGPQIVKDNM
jgi:hypothetical protein